MCKIIKTQFESVKLRQPTVFSKGTIMTLTFYSPVNCDMRTDRKITNNNLISNRGLATSVHQSTKMVPAHHSYCSIKERGEQKALQMTN